jgi:ribosome maturation factor RimP
MRKAPEALEGLIRQPVEAMGYELVGVELFRKGQRAWVLRVYIDQEGGIDLGDCSAVSHQLSGVLDVEDPIGDHYDLEVSSPGLDRPLFELAHFARFAGHRARVVLHVPLDGRRKLVGVLTGTEDDSVLLEDGEVRYRIPLPQIASARLVPDF